MYLWYLFLDPGKCQYDAGLFGNVRADKPNLGVELNLQLYNFSFQYQVKGRSSEISQTTTVGNNQFDKHVKLKRSLGDGPLLYSMSILNI